MVETNLTKCDLAFQLTYHPIYRFAQFWTFLVSLLAVPGLSYFILKRLVLLPFHGNLKCLLVCYFVSTLLFSMDLCFAFGYHSLVPLFVSSKCGLVIEVPFFKWVHILTLLLMTIPMMLPIAFSIERFIAIGMAHDYENVRVALGPILAIFLLGADVLIVYDIYRNETFRDNFVSFILIPSSSAQQLNNFFWLLLYVDIASFFCNCVLLTAHNRLKKRYLRQRSSLSVRYEMEEIFQSSQFTLIVSCTYLLFVGWYLVSILFVRTLGPSFFNGYINYTTARGVFCAVPTYNLLIVFIGFGSLRHLDSRRHTKIRTTVQIKSTGREGALNYEDAISRHWDSISSQMNRMKS